MNDIKLQFNIDNRNGQPCIEFIHFDNRGELLDNVIEVFVKKAQQSGIKLISPSGYAELGKPFSSHENYKIVIDDSVPKVAEELMGKFTSVDMIAFARWAKRYWLGDADTEAFNEFMKKSSPPPEHASDVEIDSPL